MNRIRAFIRLIRWRWTRAKNPIILSDLGELEESEIIDFDHRPFIGLPDFEQW